jgi:glycerol-3-phosphate O-acyltransferase
MTDSMKRLVICSLTALAMIPAKAQDDSLADAARGRSFFELQAASRVFKVTCVGVPLVAAGLVVKSEDDHFRSLRNDYLPSFNRHADDYLQYLPAAVMVGMKLGGAEGRSSWGRMLASDAFSAVIMGGCRLFVEAVDPCDAPRRVKRQLFPVGTHCHCFHDGHHAYQRIWAH